ncbi:diguanylate cyclase [Desulforudis sp. 1088]|uniref:diguanylate cyclase n=1 Tax=unclassified Candidatus Desulforudis TaxID=2635950 RepID=UPI003CE4F8CE
MKILVADDSLVSARMVQKALEEWDHSVIVARDGAEAWDILQREEIRLVIADWVMPVMDGLELCKTIRHSQQSGYVYVILLTSKGNKDDIVEGLGAGADDYITKPFHHQELKARVQVGIRIIQLEEKLREANKKIAALASTDALTGLPNRRVLLEHLEALVARGIREGRPVGVIFMDLDHFKRINDEYSHLAGDTVLQDVAKKLRTVKRVYDFLGRYGGEEFLILVEGVDIVTAGAIAERFRQSIKSTPVKLDSGVSLHVTASFGVTALNPAAPQSVDGLIAEADQALYSAKAQGRDRVCCFGLRCWDERLGKCL